eukprot:s133_g34.t1
MRRLQLWLISWALRFAPARAKSFRPNTVNWLLFDHPSALWDPPFCATRVMSIMMDFIDAAQQVVAMTGDCIGELEDPPNCANDIFGFMTDIVDIADSSAALAMACAGEVTTCEQTAMDSCEDGMGLASDLIGASGNCDIDAFLCIINVVDSAYDLISWAADIRAATQVCPKAHRSYFNRWLHKEHPDWFKYSRLLNQTSGKGSKEETTVIPEAKVSRLYRNVINGDVLTTYKRTPTRLGLVAVTHGGPILAIDTPGVVRVGSAYAIPTSNFLLGQSHNHNFGDRRLSLAKEPSPLLTLHDTDLEVFYFADLDPEVTAWTGMRPRASTRASWRHSSSVGFGTSEDCGRQHRSMRLYFFCPHSDILLLCSHEMFSHTVFRAWLSDNFHISDFAMHLNQRFSATSRGCSIKDRSPTSQTPHRQL